MKRLLCFASKNTISIRPFLYYAGIYVICFSWVAGTSIERVITVQLHTSTSDREKIITFFQQFSRKFSTRKKSQNTSHYIHQFHYLTIDKFASASTYDGQITKYSSLPSIIQSTECCCCNENAAAKTMKFKRPCCNAIETNSIVSNRLFRSW